MDIDGSRISLKIQTPEAIQQLLTSEYMVGLGGEEIEQLHFPGREYDLLCFTGHLIVLQINFQRGKFNGRIGIEQRIGSPQDRFDPRHQFVRIKRFHQVIICAQVEPFEFIAAFAFPGQHDDRSFLKSPDFFAHFPPIHLRQHNIQNDQISRSIIKQV